MKGKTVIRIAVIGGLAAGFFRLYNSMGGSRLIEDLRSDIRKDLEGFKEDISDLKEGISESIGLPNPLGGLGPEDFREKSGLNIAAEALDPDVRLYIISPEEPKVCGIAGIRDSDGFGYEFRFSSADNEEDFSGMYYNWTSVQEYPKDAPECTVYLTGEGQGVCSWQDDERKYTLSMAEGASVIKLVWMKNRICSLMTF